MRQRNVFLDYLRGCAIIIVVFGHAIQICYGDVTNTLHMVIQTFQMGLLFIISGFSVGYSEPITDIKKFVISKVKRILLPYIVWSQLNYLMLAAVSCNYNIRSQLVNLLDSQFWFLRVLFLMYIIYAEYQVLRHLLNKGKRKVNNIVSICICLMICGVSVLLLSRMKGAASLKTYIPFFVLGKTLYTLKERSTKMVSDYAKVLLGGLTVVFILSSIVLFRTEGIIQSLLDKSMALTGSAAICFIAKLMYNAKSGKKARQWVTALGKNTLPVYAIHWCIFFNLPISLYGILSDAIGIYPAATAVCIIWLVLCQFLIHVLGRAKITRVVFLGEK